MFKKFLKLLFVNLAVFIFLLLLLEVFCRLFLYAGSGANLERYRLERWIHSGVRGDGYGSEDFNNLGLYSVHENTARTGIVRVLAVGGSAVAGARDLNWPDLLADKLKEKDPKETFELLNGGLGGAVSARELYQLSKLIHLKPDIVLIYDGWNDIYFSHYATAGYVSYDAGRQDAVFGFEYRLKFWLRRHSELFCRLEQIKKNRKNKSSAVSAAKQSAKPLPIDQAPSSNPGNAEEIVCEFYGITTHYKLDPPQPVLDEFSVLYARNLKNMLELCRQAGVKAVVITQPSLMDYKSSTSAELKLPDSIQMQWLKHQDWERTIQTLYPVLKSTAKKIAAEYGVPYYDFRDVFGEFKDSTLYYIDDVHQTAEGKAIIAAAVYEKIKDLIN